MKEVNIYRIRFAVFGLILLGLIYILLFSVEKTFSGYASENTVNLNTTAALYILKEEKLSFNIDLDKLVPSAEPYVYSFSISNYNQSHRSDVDLDYNIEILSTTNLPLDFELYRNETYDATGATNIISSNTLVQDEDSSWYRKILAGGDQRFYYSTNMQDTYYLVVYFPINYSTSLIYGGLTDNIEITVDSKQVVE